MNEKTHTSDSYLLQKKIPSGAKKALKFLLIRFSFRLQKAQMRKQKFYVKLPSFRNFRVKKSGSLASVMQKAFRKMPVQKLKRLSNLHALQKSITKIKTGRKLSM